YRWRSLQGHGGTRRQPDDQDHQHHCLAAARVPRTLIGTRVENPRPKAGGFFMRAKCGDDEREGAPRGAGGDYGLLLVLNRPRLPNSCSSRPSLRPPVGVSRSTILISSPASRSRPLSSATTSLISNFTMRISRDVTSFAKKARCSVLLLM